MRRLFWSFLLAATAALAQTPPFFTDNFPGSSVVNWYGNGALSQAASGITTSGSGSLIYQPAIPDGTPEYEARVTYKFSQNGGSFITYLRATTNAQLFTNTGTFYAVEVLNPQFSGGGCSATLNLWKRHAGVSTIFWSAPMACASQFTLRIIMMTSVPNPVAGPTSWIQVLDGAGRYITAWPENSIASGQPGIGVHSAPAGNGISQIQLIAKDRVAPPVIDAPAVSAFWNKIEMQWKGVTDTGSGMYLYRLFRKGPGDPGYAFYQNLYQPTFADTVNVNPSSTYEYAVYTSDCHDNWSAPRYFSVATAPAGSVDPRLTGLRPTGVYWGALGEQIDMLSGNLNFTIPLVKAEARTGWGVTFGLNYNSQMWRADANGAVWRYGEDVGYGFGWKLLAGSITPLYSGMYTVSHYIYTDSSGAEYRLDVNTNGVWTSREGIYVTFDPATRKLWFNDGSFWAMHAESLGAEEDAGTLYPTLMQDSNGNQIRVEYRAGIGAPFGNSSSRIQQIEDIKSPQCTSCILFQWSNEPLPHLSSVTRLGAGFFREFSYTPNSIVSSPWGQSYGTSHHLSFIRDPGAGVQHTLYYNGAMELDHVVYPYGGQLRWVYRDFTHVGGRRIREVQQRWSRKSSTATEQWYQLWRHDAADVNRSFHEVTVLFDQSGSGDKVRWFYDDRRVTNYAERAPGGVEKVRKDYVWAYTNAGNADPYIGQVTTTIEPGTANQKISKVTQVLDGYGNVTQSKQYDFGMVEADARVYNNSYVTDANWTSRYIRNRLKVSTLTRGTFSREMVRNFYDNESNCSINAPPPTQPNLTYLRLHDSATYTTGFIYRGNVRYSQSPGAGTCIIRDLTGTVRLHSGPGGVAAVDTQLTQTMPFRR